MDEFKKVLFIINKFSGTGYTPELEDKIVQVSKRVNVEAVLEFTKGPGHATELAKNASGVSAVVAVGGDGTLNEVAQGLVTRSIPMGIIARGSGNGLARHLGIPLTVDKALHTLYHGRNIAMDTFSLNDRLSLNVSGIGFDGHIANLFGGRTKRGLTGYAKLTLQEFMRFREFDATISYNGDTFERKAFVIALANSSQYGNNACIAPSASVSDGLLNLTILKKIPLYRFDFVYAFFTKTLDRSPFCDLNTISEAEITTPVEVPFHVDGEPCGKASKFRIRVNPAALHVIVPAAVSGGRTL